MDVESHGDLPPGAADELPELFDDEGNTPGVRSVLPGGGEISATEGGHEKNRRSAAVQVETTAVDTGEIKQSDGSVARTAEDGGGTKSALFQSSITRLATAEPGEPIADFFRFRSSPTDDQGKNVFQARGSDG